MNNSNAPPDTRDTPSTLAGPGPSAGSSDGEPWDDDDGRTLITAGAPGFALGEPAAAMQNVAGGSPALADCEERTVAVSASYDPASIGGNELTVMRPAPSALSMRDPSAGQSAIPSSRSPSRMPASGPGSFPRSEDWSSRPSHPTVLGVGAVAPGWSPVSPKARLIPAGPNDGDDDTRTVLRGEIAALDALANRLPVAAPTGTSESDEVVLSQTGVTGAPGSNGSSASREIETRIVVENDASGDDVTVAVVPGATASTGRSDLAELAELSVSPRLATEPFAFGPSPASNRPSSLTYDGPTQSLVHAQERGAAPGARSVHNTSSGNGGAVSTDGKVSALDDAPTPWRPEMASLSRAALSAAGTLAPRSPTAQRPSISDNGGSLAARLDHPNAPVPNVPGVIPRDAESHTFVSAQSEPLAMPGRGAAGVSPAIGSYGRSPQSTRPPQGVAPLAGLSASGALGVTRGGGSAFASASVQSLSSRQAWVLAVFAVVCCAIFALGLALFATTKF